MSNTYLCFSDESGGYHQYISDKQLEKHPFYLRGTLIFNSKEWKALNQNFLELKQEFKIPLKTEIKWSDLYPLKDGNTSKGREWVKRYKYDELLSFIDKSLGLISNLIDKKIILTFTPNEKNFSWKNLTILEKHLKFHLQRINNELSETPWSKIGLIFLDPVSEFISKKENKELSEFYNDLFLNGDEYIRNYSQLMDCVNFHHSNQSSGIQLTDFISGTFNSFLKYDFTNPNNYLEGTRMFFEHVFPFLRVSKDQYQTPLGYGIIDVHVGKKYRKWISQKINQFQNQFQN